MAATGAATSTRDRWTGLSAFVAAKTPAVNSSESPGRKKPSNSPVSAKMISRMPSSPNVSTRDRASSQLTARTASYSACGIPYWIGDVVSDRNRLISRHPATFRHSFAIDVRIRTEVEEIDLDRREVRARDLETGST